MRITSKLLFASCLLLPLASNAATVRLKGVSDPGSPPSTVLSGETFTVSLEGIDFQPTDGGTFSVSWDGSILQYVGNVGAPSPDIANPPWDISFITDNSPTDGLLDFVSVGITSGAAGPAFDIGTLTFMAVRFGTTTLEFADALGGWTDNVGSVSYLDAQVHVVPVPAAAPLLVSALAVAGLIGRRRRGNTPSSSDGPASRERRRLAQG